jgi:hypothetical protein
MRKETAIAEHGAATHAEGTDNILDDSARSLQTGVPIQSSRRLRARRQQITVSALELSVSFLGTLLGMCRCRSFWVSPCCHRRPRLTPALAERPPPLPPVEVTAALYLVYNGFQSTGQVLLYGSRKQSCENTDSRNEIDLVTSSFAITTT